MRLLAGGVLLALALASGSARSQVPSGSGPVPQGGGTSSGDYLPLAGGTVTGSTYFENGKPWCDVRAKGASNSASAATNDAAFAACVTQLSSSGGIIYVSSGNYNLSADWAINGSTQIIVQGAGVGATLLNFAGGGNDAGIVITNAPHVVRDLFIEGYNSLSATKPTIRFGPNAGAGIISNVNSFYGTGIQLLNDSISVVDTSVGYSYGTSLALVRGGVRVNRSSFDQGLTLNTPTIPYTISARANSHAYVAGDVVTMTQGGKTWKIQYLTNGTSAASAPTILPFGQTFTDGTATAALQAQNGMALVDCDSHCSESVWEGIDFSGSASDTGMYVHDDGDPGSAPSYVKVTDSVFCCSYVAGIFLNAGSDFTGKGLEIGGGLGSTSIGVKMVNSWKGGLTLTASHIFNPIGVAFQVNPTAGFNGNVVIGNTFLDCLQECVLLDANIGGAVVSNNDIDPTDSSNAIIGNAGNGDHIRIVANNVHGSTISVSATGANVLEINNCNNGVCIPSWTPTDASGAGLSLTANDAKYYRSGKSITFLYNITYPATADGSTALIGGLPVAAFNGSNSDQGCLIVGGNAAAVVTNILIIKNGTTFRPDAAGLGGVTNASLSGKTIAGSCTYFTN